jgi:ribosomal protein L29
VGAKKEREELRQKTLEELAISLRDAKKEILAIRTNIATRKEEDNNRSKMLKRRIARILTVIGEKQGEAVATGAPAAGAER